MLALKETLTVVDFCRLSKKKLPTLKCGKCRLTLFQQIRAVAIRTVPFSIKKHPVHRSTYE